MHGLFNFLWNYGFNWIYIKQIFYWNYSQIIHLDFYLYTSIGFTGFFIGNWQYFNSVAIDRTGRDFMCCTVTCVRADLNT